LSLLVAAQTSQKYHCRCDAAVVTEIQDDLDRYLAKYNLKRSIRPTASREERRQPNRNEKISPSTNFRTSTMAPTRSRTQST